MTEHKRIKLKCSHFTDFDDVVVDIFQSFLVQKINATISIFKNEFNQCNRL